MEEIRYKNPIPSSISNLSNQTPFKKIDFSIIQTNLPEFLLLYLHYPWSFAMSKALKAFGISFIESFQKLYKEHTPGARIFPPKTDKNDKNAQLRVDAGEVINGRKYVYLQVNTQATNEALRKWVKKKWHTCKACDRFLRCQH